MKILFYTGSMGKGGAERVIANISNELVKKNEIIIVTSIFTRSEYDLNSKIKLLSLDSSNGSNNFVIKNINRLIALKRIIKNYKPDICISFLPEPSYRLMIVNFFKKYKTIISVRNDPNIEYNNFFKRLLVKILYSRADGFVFQTDDAKNFFSNKIKSRSVIISNPINDSFLCKPFVGDRDKSIISVGRLTKQKNTKLLIEAFKSIVKKHNDYVLKIYGDGELKEELIDYCKKLKIDNKVNFFGNVNDVKTEIYKAGIFVLTSNYEGMPNALMEAMALGIPSVSIDCPCGGPKYLIGTDRGILVKNKCELIDAVNNLIEDKDKALMISKNAHSFCMSLSCKNISKQWFSFMNKVLKG